jgi:voltage-dependent calcium channel L type alpha-1D
MLLSLFRSFIMYNTQASVSWWTWLLHVSMAIIGSYLISNLIIAVLFIHFTRNYAQTLKKEGSTNNLLAVPSIVLITLASQARVGNVPVHPNPTYLQRLISAKLSNHITEALRNFRSVCFVLQGHRWCEVLTITMIVLNSIVLGIVWFPDEPISVEWATNYANYAFTFYFLLEMIIKIIGLGPKHYWADNYNKFDGLVTIVGVIDVSLDLAPGSYNQTILSVFRTLRLLRIFRLARSWKSLRRVIRVLFLSLVSVAWLTLLLALFLFICGLLGMSFFGYNLDQCPVSGSVQLCPPGLTWRDCPAHFDCYVRCDASQVYQWFDVSASCSLDNFPLTLVFCRWMAPPMEGKPTARCFLGEIQAPSVLLPLALLL